MTEELDCDVEFGATKNDMVKLIIARQKIAPEKVTKSFPKKNIFLTFLLFVCQDASENPSPKQKQMEARNKPDLKKRISPNQHHTFLFIVPDGLFCSYNKIKPKNHSDFCCGSEKDQKFEDTSVEKGSFEGFFVSENTKKFLIVC